MKIKPSQYDYYVHFINVMFDAALKRNAPEKHSSSLTPIPLTSLRFVYMLCHFDVQKLSHKQMSNASSCYNRNILKHDIHIHISPNGNELANMNTSNRFGFDLVVILLRKINHTRIVTVHSIARSGSNTERTRTTNYAARLLNSVRHLFVSYFLSAEFNSMKEEYDHFLKK